MIGQDWCVSDIMVWIFEFLSVILKASIDWSQKSPRWAQKWEPDLRRCFHVRQGKDHENTEGISLIFLPFFRTLTPWSIAVGSISIFLLPLASYLLLPLASYLLNSGGKFGPFQNTIVGLSVIYLWCSFRIYAFALSISVEHRFLFCINWNVFC